MAKTTDRAEETREDGGNAPRRTDLDACRAVDMSAASHRLGFSFRNSQEVPNWSAFEPMDYPMHRRLTVMASPTGGGLYSSNTRVGYSDLEQYQRIGVI
jgi:hypothetical protein